MSTDTDSDEGHAHFHTVKIVKTLQTNLTMAPLNMEPTNLNKGKRRGIVEVRAGPEIVQVGAV